MSDPGRNASRDARRTETAGIYDPLRPDVPDASPARVVLLGATGSIGTQTIDLALRMPDRIRIVGMSANSRAGALAALVRSLRDRVPDTTPAIAVVDPDAHAAAAADPDLKTDLLPPGREGLKLLAALDGADVVVNGLVGAAGLEPTIAAAEAGRRIALANKESLVVGGRLVKAAVDRGGAVVIPVDSEHSALAQCLRGRSATEVESLILTASGGPFRTMDREALKTVTREQVLNHPTWNMGDKITVDSATLMNKGLEVIEAHELFGMPYDRIEVLVHPGSTVHSLVAFADGAVMAQLGLADMHLPILYAIAGETHWPMSGERLDLATLGTLRFETPDTERFPCLELARRAGEAGGSAPIALNAANEVAVQALLDDRLGYADIVRIIGDTLAAISQTEITHLEAALGVDDTARRIAHEKIAALPGR